jgi:hypothetical protein
VARSSDLGSTHQECRAAAHSSMNLAASAQQGDGRWSARHVPHAPRGASPCGRAVHFSLHDSGRLQHAIGPCGEALPRRARRTAIRPAAAVAGAGAGAGAEAVSAVHSATPVAVCSPGNSAGAGMHCRTQSTQSQAVAELHFVMQAMPLCQSLAMRGFERRRP